MLWPGYIEHAYPLRCYAVMDNAGNVTTEHGETARLSSWDDARAFLYSANAVLLVGSMTKLLKWGAPRDTSARCNATRTGTISTISVRYPDSKVRSIVRAGTWGETLNQELPQKLRRLMRLCGVGDRTTPSQLGQALMRQSWAGTDKAWHYSPPRIVQSLMYKYSCPPRTETPGVGSYHVEAWEYDINNAFASHFDTLPCGQTITISPYEQGMKENYATWFRRCEVRIVPGKKPTLSPIPVFDGDKWIWDKKPGRSYVTWLWKEQAIAGREAGIEINPSYGFAWYRFTHDFRDWITQTVALKASAPADILPMVKLMIVASVGRYASGSDTYEVIDYYDPSTDCRPVYSDVQDSPFTDYYVALRKKGNGNMIHWQRYSVMRTNQTLYELARDLMDGELLATNFDSVLSTRRLDPGVNWKETLHRNIRIPYPRSVVSSNKVRLPGRKKLKQERLVA